MKNATSPDIANWIFLPSLTIQQAAMITGGNTGTIIDATKPAEPVSTTNNEEPLIPDGRYSMRPPFAWLIAEVAGTKSETFLLRVS